MNLLRSNKSANTDPQQQKAASPKCWWSGCLYVSLHEA
jgi:hypothetical protein